MVAPTLFRPFRQSQFADRLNGSNARTIRLPPDPRTRPLAYFAGDPGGTMPPHMRCAPMPPQKKTTKKPGRRKAAPAKAQSPGRRKAAPAKAQSPGRRKAAPAKAQSPGHRKAAPAKVQSRSDPKVKALAIADPVLREDVSHGRRKAAPAKAQSRSAPEVKALAIADPVIREHVSAPEVKALAIADSVLREHVYQRNSHGLMQVAFAWSPLGLLAAQAAFWGGLVGVAPRR
jgi:hypothetical protein